MISVGEYQARRQWLMEQMGPEAMAVIAAAPRCYRSHDVPWPYRQDSDFLYLTGFSEPDAVLVLLPGRQAGEQILFCRDGSEENRLWHGEVIGLEAAVEQLGVDDAFPIEDMDDILPGMLEHRRSLYYSLGRHQELDQRLMEWTRRLRILRDRQGLRVPEEFHSLEHLLHEMRLIKSPAEQDLLRQAAQASVECHLACWNQLRQSNALHERGLAATFACAAGMRGLELAYPPIVAAGRNACVLHHEAGLQSLADQRLLLLDGGVEVAGYAADITRCIPPSGRYDARDRTLLDIVLAAREAAAEQLRPGNRWDAVHLAAVRVVTAGLVDIGLLQGSVDGLVEQGAYKPFFMTRTGHWLGLDVHDAGSYRVRGRSRPLESGMVVALEPGLLIRPQHAGRKRSWYHRVMRVEDNYLIHEHGAECLSDSLPSQADKVEAELAQA